MLANCSPKFTNCLFSATSKIPCVVRDRRLFANVHKLLVCCKRPDPGLGPAPRPAPWQFAWQHGLDFGQSRAKAGPKPGQSRANISAAEMVARACQTFCNQHLPQAILFFW